MTTSGLCGSSKPTSGSLPSASTAVYGLPGGHFILGCSGGGEYGGLVEGLSSHGSGLHFLV